MESRDRDTQGCLRVLERDLAERVFRLAFDSLAHFLTLDRAHGGQRPMPPAVSDVTHDARIRSAWAVDFAAEVAGITVTEWGRLPDENALSWLMAAPEPAVVLAVENVRRVADTLSIPVDVLIARLILLEVGHIKLFPHLMAQMDSRGFAARSTADQYAAASLYAVIVLGLLLSGRCNDHGSRDGQDGIMSVVL